MRGKYIEIDKEKNRFLGIKTHTHIRAPVIINSYIILHNVHIQTFAY